MNASVGNLRTLVLNADMQPLSYAPLSVWSWQDAFVAVHQERVVPVVNYEGVHVHSANARFEVPSVVALKRYHKHRRVTFTRYHVFLRDEFRCQYCGERFSANDLTFDHVIPRSRGGLTRWGNIVAACQKDNLRKANHTPEEARMKLLRKPFQPTPHLLDKAARRIPIPVESLHRSWLDFLYWDAPLES